MIQPVLVAIGSAGAQPFDHVVRKQRVLDLPENLVAFPGVLCRIGRGEDDPSAPGALEGRRRPDRGALRRFGTVAERTTVAAVEDEDEALRCAAIHARRHIRGFDGRAGEHGAFGVAHGQIQMALLVAHAVAREVEQEQVVAMLGVEEPRDRLADGREPFVQEGNDLVEGADARGLQDLGERADIDVRRRELGEPGVLVLAVPDDERELARHEKTRLYCGRGVPPGGVSVSVIFWMSSCTASSDAPSGYSMSTERSPTLALIFTVRSLPRSDQACRNSMSFGSSCGTIVTARAPIVIASTDLLPGRRAAGRLKRDGFDAEVLNLTAEPAREGVDVLGEGILATVDDERKARNVRIAGHQGLSYLDIKRRGTSRILTRADSSTHPSGI